MATTAASRRSLRGFVVLLISILLLLISVYHGLSPLNRGSAEDVFTHTQAADKSLPVLNFQNQVAQSLSLQLEGRDTNANFSSSHIYSKGRLVHIKRAALFEDEFQSSKRHGEAALHDIETALLFCGYDQGPNFGPRDFVNGWSRTDLKRKGYSPTWDTVFEKLFGKAKVPTEQQSLYTELVQNKPFTNRLNKQTFEPLAIHKQYYFPSLSAIVIGDINSPANQVRRRFRNILKKPVPSNLEIADEYVPPLSRWSDITWTIWAELSNNENNLRYLGHDNTANLRTAHVIEYIFTKHGRSDSSSDGSSSDSSSDSSGDSSDGPQQGSQAGSSADSSADDEDELDFPGLEFGMDTDEGKALLGTPNGIGTARLLIDRARQLGKRELKVNIFTREDGQYCMLWDMAPVGQSSTPGRGGKKYRVRGHGFRHKL
ncbi:MAG: hypothetical protein Q9210_005855 [Variospora velana]